MELKRGESQELNVFAFPKEVGTFEDVIVCTVASNPSSVEFPISCVGAKPFVEARLTGDLETSTSAAAAAAAAAAPPPAAKGPPGKGAKEDPLLTSNNLVSFGLSI